MLRVAISALKARRSQSAILVVLAALVTAAAVAAPFFVYASVEKLSALDVSAAPAAQREVTVSHAINLQTDAAGTLATEFASIPNVLRLPGFTGINSVRITTLVGPDSGPAVGFMSYREGVCDHVAVQGGCPTAPGDAMISAATAAYAGVHLGSILTVSSTAFPKPVRVHVVGVYAPRDPGEPYWGHFSLEAQLSQLITSGYHTTDAIFVSEATITATAATAATVDRDMVLNGVLSVRDSIADADAVFNASGSLAPRNYVVTSALRDLSNKMIIDTNQIFIGVPIGAVELVVFGWFALFFSIRATAQARRFDVGILKLRGVRRRSLWRLMIDQSALPLAAGLPFGLVLGFFGARIVAGPVTVGSDVMTGIALAAAAAILAVFGGLLAALLAERSALATPVGELLRSTPARRRAWTANVIDLILVVIALTGVVEIHTVASADGAALSSLAPILVAFAAGLLATRLLAPLAKRAVAVSRRTGRSRGLLVSTYLARRPGLDRLVSLLTIAVALCGYSIMAGAAAAQARAARATLEVGSANVLTVAPIAPTKLMDAVRAADPSGRYAMAATEVAADTSSAVLAVDSTRLSAIVPRGAAGDDDPATIAALIRPTPARNVAVSGTDLQLTVDALTLPVGPAPAYAVASMITSAGYTFASFGPLMPGSQTYPGKATGCSATSGCELVGFQLTGGPSTGGPISPAAEPGTSVVITDLQVAGADGPVIDATALRTLPWRTTSNPQGIGLNIQASTAGLRLTIPPATYGPVLLMDPTAYLPSTPAVIPAIVAGPLPDGAAGGLPTIRPFGFDAVFVQVVAARALLPRLENGGVLVDLDYVQALAGADTGGQTSEVWLAPDAPPGIRSALAKQGLVITATESIDGRIQAYADEPAVVGLQFQELGGIIALAIAAAVLLLAASVECRPRARELAALRRQGVPQAVTRGTTFLIYGVIAGGAFVAGTLGAIADRLLANNEPLFRDGWHLLPRPPALPPGALASTIAVTAVALAFAAVVAAYQVVRAQATEARVNVG